MSDASSTYTLTSQELASAKSTLEALQERVIIKEGDTERLAGMMVADGDLYSGSLQLLADPDWSVRMGMMVVLEGVAERCQSTGGRSGI